MSAEHTDPHEGLRRAAETKSVNAVAAAHRAIMALQARGQAVNFNTVAAEAGVSKGFLYSHADLRRTIADLRSRPAPPVSPTRAGLESREAGLATKYAAISAEAQRLRAENDQLREENARLRGDLADEQRRRRV